LDFFTERREQNRSPDIATLHVYSFQSEFAVGYHQLFLSYQPRPR